MSKESILIIDDEPDNLNLLTEILTINNYQVHQAVSGQLALALVKTLTPDLILLDVRMPRMDGYEVCMLLKASQRTRDIPVIFLSGVHEILDKAKTFTVGGADYIKKPYDIPELLARIEKHLKQSRQRKLLKQAMVERERALNQCHPDTTTI